MLGGAAPSDTAGQLVGAFDRFCLPHVGDAAGLRAEMARVGIPPVPDEAPVAMLARPGHVFETATDVWLLSLDSGLCGVMGGAVDGGAVLGDFAAAMKARGVDVASVGNAPLGSSQAYRLRGPTLDVALMLGIHGVQSGAATVSMLAAPGRGGR